MPMSISRFCRNEGSLPIATISSCSFVIISRTRRRCERCPPQRPRVRANPSKRLHPAATTRLRREAEASYRAGRWQDGWTLEYGADRAEEEVFICRLERER